MLFPKPVRRVFYLLLFLGIGYYGYIFVTPHLTQEAVAFKRYSNALKDGQLGKVHDLIEGDYAKKPFEQRTKRDHAVDGEIRLVYHRIKVLNLSEDGMTANISVRQVIRYDPPGVSSLLGETEMINFQTATLVREQSSWKVSKYQDNFFPESG